jgi:2-keto-3-deoxy-L-rhamnonate aldolase RhmA
LEVIARFKERLKAGDVCLGVAITLSDPLVIDALGNSIDFLWIDLEHTTRNPETLNGHLLAARARGVPAIVRVTSSDTAFIKPVLDAGADGIVVPQIRSVTEVERVVSDCRYPPQGRRGYGPRVPSDYGRDAGTGYVERANRHLFVAVQIETAEALAALDDILSVPGLDSLVIGPWDLSGALGHFCDVEHPEVVEAAKVIIAKTRAAGLPVGAGMGLDIDYATVMIERGVQWVQLGEDYCYLLRGVDQVAASVRARVAAGISDA